MNKITAGPWAVAETSEEGIVIRQSPEAAVMPDVIAVVYEGWVDDIAARNADLVAAAPELRDALAALVDSGYPDRTAIEAARTLLARLGVTL